MNVKVGIEKKELSPLAQITNQLKKCIEPAPVADTYLDVITPVMQRHNLDSILLKLIAKRREMANKPPRGKGQVSITINELHTLMELSTPKYIGIYERLILNKFFEKATKLVASSQI